MTSKFLEIVIKLNSRPGFHKFVQSLPKAFFILINVTAIGIKTKIASIYYILTRLLFFHSNTSLIHF